MFSRCYSLSQAPTTILCLKYDSNLHVGSSAFAFLFPPHHAEAETCDDCVTFPEDLGGSVNPAAPDGVRHSPNALMFLPPDSLFALAQHVLLSSFPRWHKILSFKRAQNFFLSKSDFINVTPSLVIESIWNCWCHSQGDDPTKGGLH